MDFGKEARDVAYWHLADMATRPPDVCFRGSTGQPLERVDFRY
jgi:hypothetical protein